MLAIGIYTERVYPFFLEVLINNLREAIANKVSDKTILAKETSGLLWKPTCWFTLVWAYAHTKGVGQRPHTKGKESL